MQLDKKKNKSEIHKSQNRGGTDKIWTEIDTDIAMGTVAES